MYLFKTPRYHIKYEPMSLLAMMGIGAAASGASAGISAAASGKMNAKTLRYNKWALGEQQRFAAQEAQVARQWQEDYYRKYASPSAQVKQYQDAGLNPAMMYQNGASTGSVPGGASAASPSALPANLQNPLANIELLQPIMDAFRMKAEIANINAQTESIKEQTQGFKIANEWNPKLFKMQYNQGELDLDNTIAGINFTRAQEDKVYDDILTNIYLRDKSRIEAEGLSIQNFKTRVDIGLSVLKGICDAYESNARVSEIKTRTIEQKWINEMINKYNVNPRFAGENWQTILAVLEGGEDMSERIRKHYDYQTKLNPTEEKSKFYRDSSNYLLPGLTYGIKPPTLNDSLWNGLKKYSK